MKTDKNCVVRHENYATRLQIDVNYLFLCGLMFLLLKHSEIVDLIAVFSLCEKTEYPLKKAHFAVWTKTGGSKVPKTVRNRTEIFFLDSL